MTRSACFISRTVIFLACSILISCSGHNGRPELRESDEGNESQYSEYQPIITFDNLDYDFGTIIEGEKVLCYFDFENTGGSELLLSAVEADCGCTTSDWSSEPLKPGERRSLQIIFDTSGRSGIQRKQVTVKSNASNSVVKLILKANIET